MASLMSIILYIPANLNQAAFTLNVCIKGQRFIGEPNINTDLTTARGTQ